jgi:FkbM family methyltransferase
MQTNTMDLISKLLRWAANAPFPRGLKRSFARKFRRRNFGKTIQVTTVDGCQLNLRIGDNVDNEIAITGCFEPHLTDLIRELASGAKGGFLDVGCHLGYYSTLVGKIVPNVEITVVDANPIMAERCAENLRLNGIKGQVINVGVGAENAVLEFKVSKNAPSLGTFGVSPVTNDSVEKLRINVVPFSEIIDQIKGNIFLLKMDVEGFEYLALSTLQPSQVARIQNMVFEFSDERLRQCGQSKESFEKLKWISDFEICLIGINGEKTFLNSLSLVPDGDQNIWLRRR